MLNNKDWLGRPVLSDKHHNELELQAAIGQFAQKLPKEQAEHQAYQKYLQDHSVHGAAHHLSGIQSALAANDHVSAQKHGILYNLHAKNAGFDPMGEPPEHVQALVNNAKSAYRFKAHPADTFLANQPMAKTELLIKNFADDPKWATRTALFLGGGRTPKEKKMKLPKPAKAPKLQVQGQPMSSIKEQIFGPKPGKGVGGHAAMADLKHALKLK